MYPDSIILTEVGPRDGFQMESVMIPTERKARIITALVRAGISRIQICSFVHPARVPQMADAEELIKMLPEQENTLYTGLALNPRGVERAWQSGLKAVEISVSASDTHSRKNAGMSRAQALEQARKMLEIAGEKRMHLIASVQCAFGCVYEGRIPAENVLETVRIYADAGTDLISLADTTGMADPLSVRKLVSAVQKEISGRPLGLHLHDTRGLGLVNLMAGLECGIRHFDTAFGGMGGCPFVSGAAGNICTEDTAYLMESLRIRTGIDRHAVAECSRDMAAFLGKQLPGRLHRMEI